MPWMVSVGTSDCAEAAKDSKYNETDIDANVNYKAAYEGAMMQIEALHKIIEENKRR